MFSVVFALASCSESRKLDSIDKSSKKTQAEAEGLNQNTRDLNRNTKDLRKGIGDLNGQVDDLGKELEKTKTELELARQQIELVSRNTKYTYQDLRKSQTLEQRRGLWAEIVAPSSPLESRVVAAFQFFAAQEYQLWKDGLEDEADRDRLQSEGVQEFSGKFLGLINAKEAALEADPVAFPKDSRQEAIFALGLGLEMSSPTAVSFDRLIFSGLTDQRRLELGEIGDDSLSKTSRQVILQASALKFLLSQRVHSLSAFAVANLSQMSQSFPWNLVGLGLMRISPWKARTVGKNSLLLKNLAQKMESSLLLKTQLQKELGGASIAAELKEVLGNMRVPEIAQGAAGGTGGGLGSAQDPSLEPATQGERLEALKRIEASAKSWAQN